MNLPIPLQVGLTDWIQLIANVVLAIFTVVLALVTYLYYKQTREQTTEMEKSRKATAKQAMQMEKTRKLNLRPKILPFATHNMTQTFYFMALENIGEGIAKNLHVEWYIKGIDGSERVYDKPTFQPSERRIFTLPLEEEGSVDENMEKIKRTLEGTSGKLVVDITYQDVLDNSYDYHYEIDIVEQLEGRADSGEMQSDDLIYSNLGRYETPAPGDSHDV